jgi:hypothetical protein
MKWLRSLLCRCGQSNIQARKSGNVALGVVVCFWKKKKVQHGVGYSFLRDDVVVGEGEGYSTCSSWGECTYWRDAAFCRPAGKALQGGPNRSTIATFLKHPVIQTVHISIYKLYQYLQGPPCCSASEDIFYFYGNDKFYYQVHKIRHRFLS